jgi:membrane carboxypeptidase/penicillin-binding protein PbpC
MERKIGTFSLLFVFASLAFSGCFSSWKGDEATLTLLPGGSSGSRATRGPENNNGQQLDMVRNIELIGPTGRQSHTVEGDKPFSTTVMPGYWEITVLDFRTTEDFQYGRVYSKGSVGADIKAGQDNTVNITMRPLTVEIIIRFPFNDGDKYNIIISDNGDQKKQFTVTVDCDSNNIQWFLSGAPIDESRGKKTITINAADYDNGDYQLVVMVIDENGVPYSAEITLRV